MSKYIYVRSRCSLFQNVNELLHRVCLDLNVPKVSLFRHSELFLDWEGFRIRYKSKVLWRSTKRLRSGRDRLLKLLICTIAVRSMLFADIASTFLRVGNVGERLAIQTHSWHRESRVVRLYLIGGNIIINSRSYFWKINLIKVLDMLLDGVVYNLLYSSCQWQLTL